MIRRKKELRPCGKIYTLRLSHFFVHAHRQSPYALEFSAAYEI
jgi:hypothetical protein